MNVAAVQDSFYFIIIFFSLCFHAHCDEIGILANCHLQRGFIQYVSLLRTPGPPRDHVCFIEERQSANSAGECSGSVQSHNVCNESLFATVNRSGILCARADCETRLIVLMSESVNGTCCELVRCATQNVVFPSMDTERTETIRSSDIAACPSPSEMRTTPSPRASGVDGIVIAIVVLVMIACGAGIAYFCCIRPPDRCMPVKRVSVELAGELRDRIPDRLRCLPSRLYTRVTSVPRILHRRQHIMRSYFPPHPMANANPDRGGTGHTNMAYETEANAPSSQAQQQPVYQNMETLTDVDTNGNTTPKGENLYTTEANLHRPSQVSVHNGAHALVDDSEGMVDTPSNNDYLVPVEPQKTGNLSHSAFSARSGAHADGAARCERDDDSDTNNDYMIPMGATVAGKGSRGVEDTLPSSLDSRNSLDHYVDVRALQSS